VATGSDLVDWALAQKGKPYEWGTQGPGSYDCSGLIWQAARQYGIAIPRTTADMFTSPTLQTVSRNDLQPGDIVLSKWDKSSRPVSHAAMWVGDGTVVEAPEQGQPVRVTPFGAGYEGHAVAYKRIPTTGSTTQPAQPGFLAGIAGAIGDYIPKPSNVTDALSNIGSAGASLAKSAQSIAKGADLAVQAFAPGNLLRGFVGGLGLIFLLIGIWFLAREVRDSTP